MLGALVAEHERGLGGWSAEWETWTDLLALAGSAAARTRDTVAGLEIDPQAMAANLARTGGVLMAERVSFALTPVIGRDEAEAVVAAAAQRARSSGRSFARELGDEPAVVNALGQDDVAERLAELL